ncbi:LAMI_0H04390g1_1 [Lachancea mirantina]|uniref:LAMI_0H04390g1_1 n=1 Tax=Lachancea mirantina TaxID=1230905 RepID=A0A1G4KEL6_9SACH|nr:LAMI_0H04390g1_1 [Lachancea mirantina]
MGSHRKAMVRAERQSGNEKNDSEDFSETLEKSGQKSVKNEELVLENNVNGMNSSGSEQNQEDDELDLADVSSDDGTLNGEDSEKDESEDEDDDFPKKKKAKMSKHDDGSAGFSTAVNAILSSHLKAYDRADPIMARNKGVLKKSQKDKLEVKAKKAILAEKKKLLNKTRKKDIIPVVPESESGEEIRKILEKERKLRKIAQKGVVKLFNVVLATQVKTEKENADKLDEVKNKGARKELLTDLSKERFLDLVKTAGDP